jgi:hypothetical protein
MRIILLILFNISLFAGTSFMTQQEYASSLYKNPRGIGCDKCHGKRGHGKLIATYVHNGKKKRFEGCDITKLSFAQFYKALNSDIFGMPHYFLTREEIVTLYNYLQKNKGKK